jgi:hypothetical protein
LGAKHARWRTRKVCRRQNALRTRPHLKRRRANCWTQPGHHLIRPVCITPCFQYLCLRQPARAAATTSPLSTAAPQAIRCQHCAGGTWSATHWARRRIRPALPAFNHCVPCTCDSQKQQPREAVRWPGCRGFPPQRSRCLPHGAPG